MKKNEKCHQIRNREDELCRKGKKKHLFLVNQTKGRKGRNTPPLIHDYIRIHISL
jgi:hypothetical protein